MARSVVPAPDSPIFARAPGGRHADVNKNPHDSEQHLPAYTLLAVAAKWRPRPSFSELETLAGHGLARERRAIEQARTDLGTGAFGKTTAACVNR
jgi:hypothetical protein